MMMVLNHNYYKIYRDDKKKNIYVRVRRRIHLESNAQLGAYVMMHRHYLHHHHYRLPRQTIDVSFYLTAKRKNQYESGVQ